ncbi:telomere length regulation protein TEL2 homolog [Heptranchias perlo]|uniref:telomere length regulation protein TEL2 homolog n=1 Tax=Heptranchias perlo TaxID=212740 RepID=UPI003559639A
MEPAILEVRCFVRQAVVTLSSSRDSAEVTRTLRSVKQYLGGAGGAEPGGQREEFVNAHYARFLQVLTSNLTADWLQLLPIDQEDELFDGFFLDGLAHQSYLILLDTITMASPSFRQERCLEILERFLREGRMGQLIWEVSQDHDSVQLASLRDTLLNKIVSLPDHMANKLERSNRATFYPQSYYPLLGREMLSVLERICERLKGGTDCSVSFVSQLLGKICIQGHSDVVLQVMVPQLTVLTQSDCIWQRISWRLVENVPERWMESVVSGLVRSAAGPEVLSRLLGSIVLKNKKAEFVLTHKLLLLQYHHKTSVLQSLLGYLAGEKSRGDLLMQVLKKLLETWGNSSAVRHTPVEQQLYISKAIVISLAQLTDSHIQQHKAELLPLMMTGMESHLDSNLPRVRQLGMVIAESLSARVNPGEHRLTFQYVEDDETTELRSLSSPRPLSSWASPPQQHRDGGSQTDASQKSAETGHPAQTTRDTESESELDRCLTP